MEDSSCSSIVSPGVVKHKVHRSRSYRRWSFGLVLTFYLSYQKNAKVGVHSLTMRKFQSPLFYSPSRIITHSKAPTSASRTKDVFQRNDQSANYHGLFYSEKDSPHFESSWSPMSTGYMTYSSQKNQIMNFNRKDDFHAHPSYHKFRYLQEATQRYLSAPHGSLIKGKHHELYSLLKGWSNVIQEVDGNTLDEYFEYYYERMNNSEKGSNLPVLIMESILKRVIDEVEIGKNSSVCISTDLYNLIIQAWCTMATTASSSRAKNNKPIEIINFQLNALQRASDILSQLQQTYEQTQNSSILPNTTSFQSIIEAYTNVAIQISTKLTDGQDHIDQLELHKQFKKAIQKVHYILLYQENVYRTGKNKIVKPNKKSYSTVLQMYSKLSYSFHESVQTGKMKWNFGLKAEQLLRLMIQQGYVKPSTVLYNLVLCSYLNIDMDDLGADGWYHRYVWKRKKERHNDHHVKAIEDAQRLFDEMMQHQDSCHEGKFPFGEVEGNIELTPPRKKDLMQPDSKTYALLITAWANLENSYGSRRAQDLIMNKLPNVKIITSFYNIVLKSWCRSNDRSAPRNALLIFDRMKNSFHENSLRFHSIAKPDRTTFNTVLHILSKHGTPESLQKAEDILDEMEMYEAKGFLSWAPNLFSYNIIIEGYSDNRNYARGLKSSDSALRAYYILQKILVAQKKQESDTPNFKENIWKRGQALAPDTFSFNRVIFALSKSRIPRSPVLIEELLLYMERQYHDKGNMNLRPDLYSYSSAIAAWARSNEQDAGEKAEALLTKMQELHAKGDKKLRPNVGK